MIYTHVLARPDIRVVSPLDRLSPVAVVEQESKEILPILPEAASALHEGSRDDGFGAGHEPPFEDISSSELDDSSCRSMTSMPNSMGETAFAKKRTWFKWLASIAWLLGLILTVRAAEIELAARSIPGPIIPIGIAMGSVDQGARRESTPIVRIDDLARSMDASPLTPCPLSP